MSEVLDQEVEVQEQSPVVTETPSTEVQSDKTPEDGVEGQDPVKADSFVDAMKAKIKDTLDPTAAKKPASTNGTQAGEAVIDEAWKPNLKLKVLDQEKEIEEWARPLITKDNEKQVRELFEKAYAADHLKTRRDEYQQKAEALDTQMQQYVQTVQKVRGYADKDFGRFLKEVNIAPQQVMSWVRQQLEKHEFLQRDDVPSEVKEAYTKQEEQAQRAWELEEQNQQLTSQHVDVAVQAKSAELSRQLERQEVKSFSEQFDQRLAKPGAFREFVIQHAANEWASSKGKRDLTGEEAVNETLRILGYTPSQVDAVGAASPKPNTTPSAPRVVTAQAKPTVIPNVGSGSAVAMGKKPKSLDDLRKMAKEAQS